MQLDWRLQIALRCDQRDDGLVTCLGGIASGLENGTGGQRLGSV